MLEEEQAAGEILHPQAIDATLISAAGAYVDTKIKEELRKEELRAEMAVIQAEKAKFIKNFKCANPHQAISAWQVAIASS